MKFKLVQNNSITYRIIKKKCIKLCFLKNINNYYLKQGRPGPTRPTCWAATVDTAFEIIIEADKMFIILTNNFKKLGEQNLDILILHNSTVLKNCLWIKLFCHT